MHPIRTVRSNSIRRNSVSNTRHPAKQVPRVQIFLDLHLSKTINQIKEELLPNHHSHYRRNSTFEEKDTLGKTYEPKTSIVMDRAVISRTHTFGSVKNKNISLLPNDIVLKYIKQVYAKYGIKNPFEGYLDFNSIQQNGYQNFESNPSFSERKSKDQSKQLCKQSTIKTQKKQRKISQNQARILQLKNNFKNVDTQNQRYEEENTIKKINNLIQQDEGEQIVSTKYMTELVKKSQGNISYIDNLTSLMESRMKQGYDFENDATINQAMNYNQTPQRSMKKINRLENQTNRVDISSPQVIKPKKKLFVKTRAISTKYNSIQNSVHQTPQNDKNNRVRFKDFDSSQSHENLYQSSGKMIKIQESQASIIIQNQKPKFSRLAESDCYITQIYRYCLGCEEAILNCNVVFHESSCKKLKQIYELPLMDVLKILRNKIQIIKRQINQSQLFKLNVQDIDDIRSKVSLVLKKQDEVDQSEQKEKIQNLKKADDFFSKKLLSGCQLIKKLSWFMKLKQNIQESQKISHSQPVISSQISKFETK